MRKQGAACPQFIVIHGVSHTGIDALINGSSGDSKSFCRLVNSLNGNVVVDIRAANENGRSFQIARRYPSRARRSYQATAQPNRGQIAAGVAHNVLQGETSPLAETGEGYVFAPDASPEEIFNNTIDSGKCRSQPRLIQGKVAHKGMRIPSAVHRLGGNQRSPIRRNLISKEENGFGG